MVQRKNDIWEASPTTPVTNTIHHNSLLQIYLGGPGKCGKKKSRWPRPPSVHTTKPRRNSRENGAPSPVIKGVVTQ